MLLVNQLASPNMGVPHNPKTYNENENFNENRYPSSFTTPSSETPFSIFSSSLSKSHNFSSNILSDYLSTGLSSAFLEKYQRELTIAASTFSVLILIIIGTCLWCLVGLVKREYDKQNPGEVETVEGGGGSTSTGKKSGDELDSSFSSSGGNTKSKVEETGQSCNKWPCGKGNGRKGIPIISRIFSKHNGNGTRILSQHRNIITPDQSIPFIIPTVSK